MLLLLVCYFTNACVFICAPPIVGVCAFSARHIKLQGKLPFAVLGTWLVDHATLLCVRVLITFIQAH